MLFILLDLGRRRLHCERDPAHCAGELVFPFLVILGYRRAEVFADVLGFVSREDESFGLVDPALRDLLIVDVERADSAFADSSAVVFEIKSDGRLARRQRILRLDRVALLVVPVVTVLEFSAFHIERPAAEAPTL